MSSKTTPTSTTNIHTGDSSTPARKASSPLDSLSLSSVLPTITTNTNPIATLPSKTTMAPPPASMGQGSSSENHDRRRRASSASSTRSSGHFAAAAVPTVSLPTPTYSSHHRSSSSPSQHLPVPPFRHRRSSSSASQDGYRSPSPGSSRTSAFVLPPGVSISQITPNVFVGNNASSTSIQTLMHYGITSMVSLLSTAEQQLNEEAWNSPALGMLVPKQNRLFVRCEDSPEEDLMEKLAMICKFVEEQIEQGGPWQQHRKQSVEEMLKSVLPASEVPKGFHTSTGNGVGQEQQPKPRQRVRSLIPDAEGRFEGPTSAQADKDVAELTKQKSRRRESVPAPQMQRVRSLIPDDVQPVPSVPSGSIPSIPSAPVPSLPGQGQGPPHLSPLLDTSSSQLSALSPAAQAGPSAFTSTSTPTSPSTQSTFEAGGKVLIHCNQGVSRSGAACVAYIMKQQPNLSAHKALRFVQVRRKEVEPSATFIRQLNIWGEECKFDVWESDVGGNNASGGGVDGKVVDGNKSGHKKKNKKSKKVPKAAYKKWLDEREEMRRKVKEMGGLVVPQDGTSIQV